MQTVKTQMKWGISSGPELVAYKNTVKPVLSGHLKRPKIGFQYQLLLYAGQKYCRMLQGEDSAILSTFIKLHVPFVFKAFVLSTFEWQLKTGFIVQSSGTEICHFIEILIDNPLKHKLDISIRINMYGIINQNEKY